MCELVALTQRCKLVSFLHLIVYSNDDDDVDLAVISPPKEDGYGFTSVCLSVLLSVRLPRKL